MKRHLIAAAAILLATSATAQTVTKRVVVEHFTNTYCSVCAARNPGFYSALRMKPEVLHIAYHPSSPYAACPLNQANVMENDARTNYYGVYGATPRLVINGDVIPANANYADTAIYSPYLGVSSAYQLRTSFRMLSATMAEVRVAVYKGAMDVGSQMYLYGAVVEDTLAFTANNGETMHYDVFRKAAPATDGVQVSAIGIGDSVVRTYNVPVNAAWNPSRMSVVMMLQNSGKAMVQAARAELDLAGLGVDEASARATIVLSPNPARDVVRVDGLPGGRAELVVTDAVGREVVRTIADGVAEILDVRGWRAGLYFVRVLSRAGSGLAVFVKD